MFRMKMTSTKKLKWCFIRCGQKLTKEILYYTSFPESALLWELGKQIKCTTIFFVEYKVCFICKGVTSG